MPCHHPGPSRPTRPAPAGEFEGVRKDFDRPIPTAEFSSFDSASAAHAYIDARGTPIVVKADGLASGKGVIVAMSADESASRGVERILVERAMAQRATAS